MTFFFNVLNAQTSEVSLDKIPAVTIQKQNHSTCMPFISLIKWLIKQKTELYTATYLPYRNAYKREVSRIVNQIYYFGTLLPLPIPALATFPKKLSIEAICIIGLASALRVHSPLTKLSFQNSMKIQ